MTKRSSQGSPFIFCLAKKYCQGYSEYPLILENWVLKVDPLSEIRTLGRLLTRLGMHSNYRYLGSEHLAVHVLTQMEGLHPILTFGNAPVWPQ